MKKRKGATALAVLLVILGAVLAFGVMFVFHACTGEAMDGMTRSCNVAQYVVFVLGLAIMLLAIVTVIVGKRGLRALLSLLIAVLGILAAVIPNNVIRLCQMPDMRCLTVMQPAVILFGILIAAIAVFSFILNVRKAK